MTRKRLPNAFLLILILQLTLQLTTPNLTEARPQSLDAIDNDQETDPKNGTKIVDFDSIDKEIEDESTPSTESTEIPTQSDTNSTTNQSELADIKTSPTPSDPPKTPHDPSVPIQWVASEYPNPEVDFTACGMTRKSHVCDPDQVLTPEQRIELDERLLELKKETSRRKRMDLSECEREGLTGWIVIMKHIDPDIDGKVTAVDTELFVQEIFERYVNPESECEKEFVYLMATEDKQNWLDPNEGVGIAEHVLSALALGNRISKLKQGDFFGAALDMIPELRNAFRHTAESGGEGANNRGSPTQVNVELPPEAGGLLGFIILICCSCFLCSCFCKGLRDCLCPCCANVGSANRDYTPAYFNRQPRPFYHTAFSNNRGGSGGDYTSGVRYNANPGGQGAGGGWGDSEPETLMAGGDWGTSGGGGGYKSTGGGAGGGWGGGDDSGGHKSTGGGWGGDSGGGGGGLKSSGGGGRKSSGGDGGGGGWGD